MTKEETKEAIKVMQAFVDGETIECRNDETCKVLDANTPPSWDWWSYSYRIKEKPTYRPYANAEECFADIRKHGGWVKDKYAIRQVCQITFKEPQGIMNDIVHIKNCCGKTYSEFLRDFVWADDGTPCGVKEE